MASQNTSRLPAGESSSSLPTLNKSPSKKKKSKLEQQRRSSERRLKLATDFRTCLAAALTDPRRGKPPSDFFTRDWGDSFIYSQHIASSEHIPKVSASKLKRIKQRITRQPHRRAAGSSKAQLVAGVRQDEDCSVAVLEAGVPADFLSPRFDVGDPNTFENMFLNIPDKHDIRAHARMMQDKLSGYLDIVELKLTQHLALRADRIFYAMSSHERLNVSVVSALNSARGFRKRLVRLQEGVAIDNLHVLHLMVQRQNRARVLAKLSVLSAVAQSQASVQALLAAADYIGALELIATTQEVLDSELKGVHAVRHMSSQLVEIRNLVEKVVLADLLSTLTRPLKTALAHESSDTQSDTHADDLREVLFPLLLALAKLKIPDLFRDYWTIIEEEFRTCVKNTVTVYMSSSSDVQGGLSAHSQLASLGDQIRELRFDGWIELLKRLFDVLLGGLRALRMCADAIDDVIEDIRPMRASVSQHSRRSSSLSAGDRQDSPVHIGVDASEGLLEEGVAVVEDSGSLHDLLEAGADVDFAAEHESEEEADLAELDARPSALASASPVKKMRDAIDDVSTSPVLSTVQSQRGSSGHVPSASADKMWEQLRADNRKMLQKALLEIHQRVSKLIQARTRDGADANLSSGSFMVFFHQARQFVAASNDVSQHKCALLEATMRDQARTFLDKFHRQQLEKLAVMLSNEPWTQAHVPSECQSVASQLCDAPSPSAADNMSSPTLIIAGEARAAVGVLLMFLQMLGEYRAWLHKMPLLSHELLPRLCEILREFNSEIRRLVLDAAAVHAAGLKRITAKQLGLASEAIAIVAAIIPNLQRDCGASLSDSKQVLLSEMDKVAQSYVRHGSDIDVKLVAIMEDVWRRSEPDMRWSKGVATEGCKALATSSSKLHKALKGIMPPSSLKRVFWLVLSKFNEKLRQAAASLSSGRDKSALVGLAADIVYLEQHLSKLSSVEVSSLRGGLPQLGIVLPPLPS